MEMELVPPGCHRRNTAEVGIQNCKSRFLGVLAGVGDNVLRGLRGCLLPQIEITVNLLQQSSSTPTVLAYAHLSGTCDRNMIPLTLTGYVWILNSQKNRQEGHLDISTTQSTVGICS